MQLEQFNFLAKADKEEAVRTYGIFINNYSIGHLNCDIYQLFDFYVGLYYELQRNIKAGIVARPSLDLLPPVSNLVRSGQN